MSGPRRCYLHVGLPKTGTSYLQSILWRSPAALADQDLQMLPHSEPATFEMMLALRGQLDPAMDPPAAFEAFDRFREEASRATCTRALVSQELLGAAKQGQISTLLEALDPFEVHVIVTVRGLAGFAPSAWQQHVKARGVKTFHEYLEDLAGMGSGKPAASYDVHGVLDRWGAQVPPERMHVVTVPKRGTSERVLLERFCSVVHVDPDALDTRAPSANTSLGLVQAELLRRVNLALGDRLPHRRAGYREQGKRFLAGEVLHPQPGEPARVPKQLADWCAEASRGLVARLERSGYDLVGDLQDLVPDEADFADDDQTVCDAELLEAATHALATILDKRHADRQDLARLRARLREQQQLIEELSRPRAWRRVGGTLARRIRRGRA
jgi:hypothetical protein